MASSSSSTSTVSPLWTFGDGTVCLLIEREQAPRFEICVLKGTDVLRQHRLFARSTAHMVADTWRHAVGGPQTSDMLSDCGSI